MISSLFLSQLLMLFPKDSLPATFFELSTQHQDDAHRSVVIAPQPIYDTKEELMLHLMKQHCENENQLQQQLCEEAHIAMMKNGTWTTDSPLLNGNSDFHSPIPTQSEADEMPLKEWARLLPVQ